MTQRSPGWHGVGRTIPPSARQPLKAAGLDWSVSKVPAEHNGSTRWSWLERSDTERAVGIVLASYEPRQNREAFGWMEEPGTRPVFAAELDEGSQVIVAAALSEPLDIPGDPEDVRVHVIATTRHDSKGSFEVYPVVVRGGAKPLVINLGGTVLRGRHGKGGGIPPREAIMLAAQDYGQRIEQLANRLLAQPYTAADVDRMIQWIKPPRKQRSREGMAALSEKQAAKAVDNTRVNLKQGWNERSLKAVKGTAWGALLSVVFHDNYLRKADDRKDSARTAQERVLLRILFEHPQLVHRAVEWLDVPPGEARRAA